MELVYLWVEEYKNIKKQGFNFSPRFKCEYDEETNELTIDENKDYKSIFPENINITAIVGENGSGKSGLVKYLAQYFSLFINKKFDALIFSPLSYIMIYMDNHSKHFHILWCVLDEVKIINNTKYDIYGNLLGSFKSTEYINLLKSKKYEEISKLNLNKRINNSFNKELFDKNFSKLNKHSFILHYDYSFDMFMNYQNNNSCILSVPNKEYDIYQHHNYDKTLLINHIVNKEYIDNNKYFEPTKISIVLLSNLTSQIQFKNELNINNFMLHLIYSSIFNLLKDRYIKVNKNNENLLQNPIELKNFIESNIHSIKSSFIEKEIKEVPLSYELESLIDYIDIVKKHNLENLIYIDSDFGNININLEYLTIDNISILKALPSKYFKLQISFYNNADYDDLSNGEKSILRIRFYIEQVIQKFKKNNYFILLDEPDNELHPRWQKKLLMYLVDIFKGRKQTFHFIITSHSPFILSDLPKENVIFLEEGKQVKPFKDDEQTFGANIHTLLSHGFFMSDGLMGEFAKGKIEEIKKFYERVKKEKPCIYLKMIYNHKIKDFRYIESIIGEPFLQTIIKNYLDELEQIFDNKRYKLKQKEKLISQFTKEELKKYLDEME